MSLAKKQSFFFSVVILVLCALIWGTSYMLIKKGLAGLTPLQVGSLRVFIAGLTVLPLFFLNAKKFKQADFKWYFVVGLFGYCIPAFLFPTAQKHIASGIAGTLNSLTPLFVLLVGLFLFKKTITFKQILGIVLGLVGAIILIMLGGSGFGVTDSSTYWYAGLIVLATFFYGISTNTIKEKLEHVDGLMLLSGSLTCALPIGFMVLTGTGFWQQLSTEPQFLSSVGAVAFLAIFSTVLASVFFIQVIKNTDAFFASTTSYIMPIVALIWGGYDGESLKIGHFLGMILILLGVYVVGRESMHKHRTKKADH